MKAPTEPGSNPVKSTMKNMFKVPGETSGEQSARWFLCTLAGGMGGWLYHSTGVNYMIGAVAGFTVALFAPVIVPCVVNIWNSLVEQFERV